MQNREWVKAELCRQKMLMIEQAVRQGLIETLYHAADMPRQTVYQPSFGWTQAIVLLEKQRHAMFHSDALILWHSSVAVVHMDDTDGWYGKTANVIVSHQLGELAQQRCWLPPFLGHSPFTLRQLCEHFGLIHLLTA